MRQCRQCHNDLERWRRATARAKGGRRRMANHLAAVRNARSERRVQTLCEAMVQGYGGMEGFVQAWLRCLEADLERGGLAAVRHLEAVIRLIQHCESSRPNYAQMTDAELESLAEALASGSSS